MLDYAYCIAMVTMLLVLAAVCGSAAGRPLINAVEHPRVIINSPCLD